MNSEFKPGDNVAYSAQFCRNIGACTGEIPAMRGVFVAYRIVGARQLAVVKWNGDSEVKLVGPGCLAKVGANRRFCAC